jgi:hypothetical protein
MLYRRTTGQFDGVLRVIRSARMSSGRLNANWNTADVRRPIEPQQFHCLPPLGRTPADDAPKTRCLNGREPDGAASARAKTAGICVGFRKKQVRES